MPIEVESLYISKYESMGSILEYLTPENMEGKQIFSFPVDKPSISTQQLKAAKEVRAPQQVCINFSETKCQESSGCSNSQSSNTTRSTLQHLKKAEFGSNESLLSDDEDPTKAQLFDRTQCNFYSDDSCSSQSIELLSEPDEDSDAEVEVVQESPIILTFSSPHSYSYKDNQKVIIMEPESADPDTISQSLLTETNLTINPLHFDPL